MSQPNPSQPIIFFDGVCGLCNGFIDFIFKVDKRAHFKVATLQGQTAKKLLDENHLKDLWSVVLWTDNKVYTQSDAIFYILRELGGAWRVLSALKIIPRGFRDVVYKLIAKNRYKLFGVKATCRMPTPQERERFLD